jgi:hypothetical protein
MHGCEYHRAVVPLVTGAAMAGSLACSFFVGGANRVPPTAHPSPEETELAKALTIMFNTSPIELHPSTVLVEEVMGALIGHLPCLRRCHKLIVCDGYKIRDAGSKYRAGRITSDHTAKYHEFIARLKLLSASGSGSVLEGAQVLVLEQRQGFGFALKAGLEHVRTPYLLVQQHDRRLRQPFDVLGVVRAMIASRTPVGGAAPVQYVGLPTTTTLAHARKVKDKFKIDINKHARFYPGSNMQHVQNDAVRTDQLRPSNRAPIGDAVALRLIPLLQWYDSTHICNTEYYRKFVFGWRGPKGKGQQLVVKGGFIEDKLSQVQLTEIRKHGIDAHADWGTFLLDDGTRPNSSTLPEVGDTSSKEGSQVGVGGHAKFTDEEHGTNWLVEHLDAHDVLAVRKFRWAPARTPDQTHELETIVGSYWERIRETRSGNNELCGERGDRPSGDDTATADKGRALLGGHAYGSFGDGVGAAPINVMHPSMMHPTT